MIAKPVNMTAVPSWLDPYASDVQCVCVFPINVLSFEAWKHEKYNTT